MAVSKRTTQPPTKVTSAAKPKSASKPKSAAKPKASAGAKAAAPRKRAASSGRPARLSRQAVLEKSIELLDQYPYPMEGFTLARVADALDTVSMALYNYFPSREALLAAVGDHICLQFKMPKAKANQTWQETLRAWLWALKKHAERYPIVLKVMGVDGQQTAGWLRITLTVSRTLYEQGMRGKELALNTWLFCGNAISLIFYEREGSVFRSPISFSHLEELDAEEQDFLLMLRPFHTQISSSDVLEEGFSQLITVLELKLAAIKADSR